MSGERWKSKLVLLSPHPNEDIGTFDTLREATHATLNYMRTHYSKLGLDLSETERGWYSHQSVYIDGENVPAMVLIKIESMWKLLEPDPIDTQPETVA